MKNKLRNSLAKQLFAFSFCILLSLLLAFGVTDRYVRSSVRRSTEELNGKILLQVAKKLSDYQNSINQIALTLAYSPTTENYFLQDEWERVISLGSMETVFSNIMLLDENIAGIFLYDEHLNLIASKGKKAEEDEVSELKSHLEFGNIFEWKQTSYYVVCSPIYDLRSQKYGRQIGMSLFLMKAEGLENFLEDSQITKHSELFLLDGNGRIVAASGGSGVQEQVGEIWDNGNGKEFLVQEQGTVIKGWKVVSRIPKEELYGSAGDGKGMIAIAYGVACILICILTYFCYRNFILGISKVNRFIRSVVTSPEERMTEEREDEIGNVIKSLNHMLDEKEAVDQKMQESQKRMYEIQLAGKQLQVLAYQNQINPHFLYNTFECICGMATYHEVEDIAEITMALSNVFRFAVKGNFIVTVGEEIAYIKQYATIIDYRFMGKIEVEINADETLYENRVIKLILQPLVENAVFHGLEQKMGDGEVKVSVSRKLDNYIMFLVEDNGCGIEEERLKQIRESLDKKAGKGRGIGLANIYQRLKLFYGEDVVFEIKSSPGKGTQIMIVLPDDVEQLALEAESGGQNAENLE